MSFAIALSDEQLELVADLFDPPARRGAPAQIPRRQMVDAILFLARHRAADAPMSSSHRLLSRRCSNSLVHT